jgi:hypothetical protein
MSGDWVGSGDHILGNLAWLEQGVECVPFQSGLRGNWLEGAVRSRPRYSKMRLRELFKERYR